jgi:hypothetical protein
LALYSQNQLEPGAPDSFRCPRMLNSKLAALGNRPGDVAKIHRTVRWCTGLSSESEPPEPTVGSEISGQHVAQANDRLGTPDCPVCTG